MTTLRTLSRRRCRQVRVGGREHRRLLTALATKLAMYTDAPAADIVVWSQAPYRVHVTLAVESSARPALVDEDALAAYIADRVAASIAPLWLAINSALSG